MTLRRSLKRCLTLILSSTLTVSGGGFTAIESYAMSSQDIMAEEMTSIRLTDSQRLLLETALALVDQLNSSDRQKEVVINIANLYRKSGDSARARALLKKAQQIDDATNTSNDIRLADSYIALGELEKADQILQDALKTLTTHEQPQLENPARIAAIYSQFPDTALVQQRLELIYEQIPNQIPQIALPNYAAPLRGLAIAYRRINDTRIVNSGLERLSQLGSRHLKSIHPKSGSTDDFFANEAEFFQLTQTAIDQRGGLIYGETVLDYASVFGEIASVYKKQGNQELAQENVAKALVLSRMLPIQRRPYSQNYTLRLTLAQAANPPQSKEILADLELELSLAKSQPLALVHPRVAMARAYRQINDHENANRVLNELLQALESSDDASSSKRIDTLRAITVIARAYAEIGNINMQQSLLEQNFDTLFSVDFATENTALQMNEERLKRLILGQGIRMYGDLLDDEQASKRLTVLESLANDPVLASSKVFHLSYLATAAAKREQFTEADRLVQSAIMAARSAPVNQFYFAYAIAIADSVSRLSDSVAIRAGLAGINEIKTAYLESIEDSERSYASNLLNRRLIENYLQSFIKDTNLSPSQN